MSQKIAYERHPVTPERKAELRARGFKIVDFRYAPAYFKPHDVPKEVVTADRIDKMRKPDLAKRLADLGVDPPKKVADMRAALKAMLIADDRPIFAEIIGEGCYRAVFQHATDPGLVVKIEKVAGANAREWAAWQAIKDTEYEPHFAPLVEIGEGWVTQVKAEEYHGTAPVEIPDICSRDADRRNFGLVEGRLVCIDMGEIDPAQVGEKMRFRRVNWSQ